MRIYLFGSVPLIRNSIHDTLSLNFQNHEIKVISNPDWLESITNHKEAIHSIFIFVLCNQTRDRILSTLKNQPYAIQKSILIISEVNMDTDLVRQTENLKIKGALSLKEYSANKLLELLEAVDSGSFYFGSDIQTAISREKTNINKEDRLKTFTKRELLFLALASQYYPAKVIAEKMNITVNTVNSYKEKVKVKLDIKTSRELLNYFKGHPQFKEIINKVLVISIYILHPLIEKLNYSTTLI